MTAVQRQAEDIIQHVDSGTAGGQYLTFMLAGEEYGVEILRVQEIKGWESATPIPNTPDHVLGVLNLRGAVVPIIDLRKRFGLEAGDPTEHTRIIVSNCGSQTYGIVVDAVNEVIRLEASKVEPPPKGVVGIDSTYIQGLVKMEERIMILLDSEGIISQGDQAAIASSSPDQ